MPVITTGQITITDANDGYNLSIIGGNRTFSYASNGSTPTPSAAGTFSVSLFRGGVSLTPKSYTWSATGVLSTTATTATFTPTLATNYSVAATTVSVSVEHNNNTITATIPILVSQAPSNAIINTLFVSAPAIYKNAADSVTTGTYTSVSVQGKRYDGTATTNFGWITITPNTTGVESARVDTGSTAFDLNTLSNSQVSSYIIRLYLAASGGAAVTSQVLNVTFKGTPGTNGTSPTLYEVAVSAPVISRSATNLLTPASIVVSGFSTIDATKSAYTGRFRIYEDGTVKYTSSADQSSYTYTPSTPTIGILKFELYAAGGTAILLDTQEVPVVVSGSSAMTFSLTNSNYPIPADNSGAVSTYVGSGTNIQVLEGSEQFTYVTTLGNATATISTVARNTSNIATITTTAAHGLATGDVVSIDCTSNTSFNAVSAAITVVNTTTFTYSNTGTSVTSVAGAGTVVRNVVAKTFTIGTPTLSVANAITVGARSGATTTTAVVAQHSAMSNTVDAVTVSYPLIYIRVNGSIGNQTVTQVITKVKAGTLGIRGSRQLYSTDALYVATYDIDGAGATAAGAASYAARATQLIAAATAGSNPTTPINGDTVTFTNGSDYVYTITHNGTSWVPPGTIIDGSLLVTGSVTASKINSNGLEVRDTNGKLLLGSGGITAGFGSNLLYNGGLEDGIAGWLAGYNTTGAAHTVGHNLNPDYSLKGLGLGFSYRFGSSVVDTVFDASTSQNYIPVTPDTRYEVSALLNAHRCRATVAVVWVDSNFAYISESTGNAVTFQSVVNTLADLRASQTFATAPATARFAYVIVRGRSIAQNDMYVFFKNVYFGQAGTGQVDFTPYASGRGIAQITSGNASTYIANAAISSAQIGSLALTGINNFSVKSATAGARMEMDSRAIKVYDSNGVLRVHLGDLTT